MDDDDGTWDYKFPDAIGNLFRTQKQTDRTYGKAGQLLKDPEYTYTYDPLGNLIKKESATETWEYVWNAQGRLSAVLTPGYKKKMYRVVKDNLFIYTLSIRQTGLQEGMLKIKAAARAKG